MASFRPSGWFEACKAGVLRTSLRLLLKPVFSPRFSIAFQRRWLSLIAKTTLVPHGVTVEAGAAGGVPGEWLRRAHGDAVQPGCILYLHGGAYCLGSPATHRSLTARLAKFTGLPVFALDYRLAPDHPFPAALDDTLAAFRALHRDGPVVIAGDSAGGGLALATALALRDASGPRPAALLLLSPWSDVVMPDPPPLPVRGEAILSPAWAQACAGFYLNGGDPRQTLTSPLHAHLRDLPPTLIQAGTDEMLHGQALDLHAALEIAGVPSTLDITEHRWHVFQLHGGVLDSADAAIHRLTRFALQTVQNAQAPRYSEHDVVIMGAGMSGICMAIQLQRTGQHNFVILEKQPGLGGTWWDNIYPGAHVDVPAPVYSFSFAPNPNWTRRFASAPEIQAYQQSLAERHGLLAHLRLNTRLTEARFDETSGHWHFQTESGDTLRSRFFICSTGPLSQPRWPDIPGLDDFQGQRLHSARWDAGVALAGRRVAVIGTGSTASQLIPPISKTAGQLMVFQRTANWVMPRLDRRYNALDRTLAHCPPYAAAVRWTWTQVLEWGRRGFDEGTLARKGMLKTASAHQRRQISDPDLRDQLTPDYPLGCKRIIYSNDFYPALGRPHVELITAAIERITPDGILTTDGQKHPVDVLVCATGFDAVHLLSGVKVTGLGGQTLQQAWHSGPSAYHGVSVAGFPNLFLMLGPNTATGHTSTLLYIEPEVQHAIACMQAVRSGNHRWIAVKPEIQLAHNAALQARLGDSVWAQCRSWYRMEGGRIVALFPGFTAEYVSAVRHPNLTDYTLT
ncbi:alpha/beta hydrolase fold domain-containing protein [Hydrogenophaga sp. PAMC20947]|uniref:alpha/beta hydrolase fold domain-containing protein n=1 Tax=Hydrogenophaga sp. PAMC20947 TaxID=2565558 RepID=UPI00109DE33C|nr:alpha/beta hydrolase fold domain-containing protein [Hydrogenophaga sp. PAMC20947]QCB48266.1 steryl acetyl hydrolase [Hydrogenophaga sp. PAMC20947]